MAQVDVVWNGHDGWLLPGRPTGGHLVTPSEVRQVGALPEPPPKPKGETAKQGILRHLQGGPLTTVELSRRVGVDFTTVQTYVSQLRKAKRIARVVRKREAVRLA